MADKIKIVGAKEHNLKNVSLEIPKNELVVFTGVSGSGKSSLAFDTIFAEGQRRYIESLSTYARQFLGQMDKPNVEYIDGLSPAISIDQKSKSNNPRSTVGTITEIYDYLRLLYARVGVPYCPSCGKKIKPQTLDEIVNKILQLGEGVKIQILAPIVRGKKGEYSSTFEELKQEGFVRVKVDGNVYNLDDDEIELAKTKKHDISVVVDRIVVKESASSRIADSVQIALKKADGIMIVDVVGDKEIVFSEKLACPDCNLSFEELTPRIFSFNAPYGACERCSGLGADFIVDPDLVVPDKSKSLNEGAIYAWATRSATTYYSDLLSSVCQACSIDMDTPFKDLPSEQQKIILYGTKEPIKIRVQQFGTHRYQTNVQPFIGVIPFLEKRYNDANGDYWREEIEKFMVAKPCPACGGARLKPFPLAVKIRDKNIYEFTKMSIDEEFQFITDLYLDLNEFQLKIAKQILDEIRERLKFLIDVGLHYLDLARMAGTLSGGESQRIRLASQIGSGLSGVLYVLDEPSIGLHQRDNDMLIKTLFKLRNLGNTLIVVEHDEDTIRSADYIVDIGPRAGIAGGEIIAQGSVEDIISAKKSITGKYLSGEKFIPIPEKIREGNGQFLQVKNAHLNNLKNVNVDIPLNKLVVVTGVSGSGKSSLINEVLYKKLASEIYKSKVVPGACKEITGLENIDKVIQITQDAIGRTPRSNPATYVGVFDDIRDLFSQTKEAKMRGYDKGRFSFNVKGGRCENCWGDGVKKIEMHFLADVYVPCDVCKGKRYNRETLEIKYKGKNISEVLDMRVSEALEFFENVPKIYNKLKVMMDVGLSYIKLGQSAPTLSGGEAGRVKLAKELQKKATGKSIFILDEPTTGLHSDDIKKLLVILNRIVDNGDTVIVIEHNLDVIKVADHIIDLGPDGGKYGGKIIATGTPEQVAKCKGSYTGEFLAKIL